MQLGEYLSQNKNPRRALLVQGGGMRAVYSIAALAAIDEAGLRDSFSLAVGSSAGAINASYFLTGDARLATRVYVESLSNSRFINPLRVKRIMDVEYLIEEILRPHGVFTPEKLASLGTEIRAIVADATTAESVTISSHSEFDWYDVMHASAAMPFLYNVKVKLGDRLFVDGAIADSLPIQHVIDDGYDEILAIATRPISFRSSYRTLRERALLRALSRSVSKPVTDKVLQTDIQLNESLDILGGITPVEGLRSWTIAPSRDTGLVNEVTADRARLQAYANMAREDTMRMLEQPVEQDLLFQL